MAKPLCFIIMPFGKKSIDGRSINFDAVWQKIIAPAIAAADMAPLRADEEQAGGIIHKPMFERLLLSEYAVCDLSFANPNVFYELGVRHAARPYTTVLLTSDATRLPFDVAMLRAMPYAISADGAPANAAADCAALADSLKACRARAETAAPLEDSPLYQLIDGIEPLQVSSDRTDVFHERVRLAEELSRDLDAARKDGKAAIDAVRDRLGPADTLDADVAVEIVLAYRAVKDFAGMAAMIEGLPAPLRATVMLQEQLAFALNRIGESERAERVLTDLIRARGPSSETLGILGRVYKDRWEAARDAGEGFKARSLLKKAADTYRKGFETDWRDHYPGINAVTLMELQDPPDPERNAILPVVRYSVRRRMEGQSADYWDWATLLELEVLASNQAGAEAALGEALITVREAFEPETTARNLRLIREARVARGEDADWIDPLLAALTEASDALS